MDDTRHNLWDIRLRIAAGAAVVIAAAWALFEFKTGTQQYFDAKAKEFQLELWKKRLEVYSAASDAASVLSSAPPASEEWKQARAQFWRLYWGNLAILEDEPISAHMVLFGNAQKVLEQRPDDPETQADLKQISLRLAWTFRRSLDSDWRSTLEYATALKGSHPKNPRGEALIAFWARVDDPSWQTDFDRWWTKYSHPPQSQATGADADGK